MKGLKQVIYGMALLLTAPLVLANTKITICTDTNFWYPFTYVKNHESAGLHIDIISASLRRLGYEPNFKPTNWKECLKHSKEGVVDGVATASYRDERAVYLNYPQGAAVDVKSPWRVTQVGYVVITPTLDKAGKKNHYEFKGNFKTIPAPVRAPQHYSAIKDLEREGLKVQEGKNSQAIFKDLIRDRTGSVIDVREVAEHFRTQPQFSDKFTIQDNPLNNKSYYLAFSKTGKIKPAEAEKIWKEIAKVRNDKKLMAEFLTKY